MDTVYADKARLVVVGRHGLIATRLFDRCEDERVAIDFLSMSDSSGKYRKIDFSSPKSFDYSFFNPGDTIALLGAMSMPDECEKKPELAAVVNVTGPIYFIENALKRGARVIFASSDIVYGEHDEPVYEQSATAPVGTYGGMKAEIEKQFADEANFKSMRLSLVYSRDDKFTRYLTLCATSGKIAEIFHPIYRSVVHIDDVVEAIKSITLKWDSIDCGIINMAGPDLLSRLDIAEIHKKALWPDLQISTTYPGDDFYKARPKVINMKSLCLETILGRSPNRISDAVKIEFQR